MKYRHVGCKSEVIRYIGKEPTLGLTRRAPSRDWQYPDGTHPTPGSLLRALCPDCGKVVSLLSELEKIK